MMRMMRIPVAWLDWFDLRRSIVWLLVVVGGYAWLVHRAVANGHSPFGVLALAPVAAFVAAPALIQFCLLGFRWIAERPLAPWQGRYYAFDDRQIRIVEARGRLWFSTVDVHAALDLRRRSGVLAGFTVDERLHADRVADRVGDREIGDALSNDGLVRLLAGSSDRRVLRFLRWAEHDVRQPWQKKRDGIVAASGSPPATSSAAAVVRRDA